MPKPLLLKRRSGLYVRFLVPGDLQGQIGSRFILRSLQGARSDTARLMASALGYALGNVFERLRREDVSNARALVDQALQGIWGGRDFTVELPNGTKLLPQSIEADHRHAQDVILALARAGALSPSPTTISVPATPKVGLLSERIEKFLAQMKVQERSETNHVDILSSSSSKSVRVALLTTPMVAECKELVEGSARKRRFTVCPAPNKARWTNVK